MTNKQLGSQFEKDFCEALSSMGYWVHFIAPDARGAQPFDIVAVRRGNAYAFDCKTSVTPRVSDKRIEDNQHMAFQKWRRCGNNEPALAILYDDDVYLIPYEKFECDGVVDLREESAFISGFEQFVADVREAKA